MPEFLDLLPPGEALTHFLGYIHKLADFERIETSFAQGRVTKNSHKAPHPLPTFARSTVDGYAVYASDTYGASESLPIYLRLIGEVSMGSTPDFNLSATECGLIHTGGMLPPGADAVVMLENTQVAKPGEIEILRSAAVGENVIKVGEDIQKGESVAAAGSLLRPADIGGLLALGITHIEVTKKPSIAIISSGDEIVSPTANIRPGQVRDINSYTLSVLVERAGAVPVRYGIVADDEEELYSVTKKALDECDLVVITAGSSASARDLTAQVINSFSGPGVISHGVNVRPGKPTILAASNPVGSERAKPVIGLPGNPVSALVIAILFVEPVIDKLLGVHPPRIRPQVQAKLGINLASQAGREDWIPVKLSLEPDGFSAEPIFGKSNLIFTLARADGLLYIPPQATGLSSGDMVQVVLL
ncbi:MAG: gephyrin-like molybdotransferase Glp [Anaerolineales bacterium]